MDQHTIGQIGEDLAREHYVGQGWCLLASRFRSRGSELDLVFEDAARGSGKIVEVKTRKTYRLSEEPSLCEVRDLINARKLASISRGFKRLLEKLPTARKITHWSFDLVLIRLNVSSRTFALHVIEENKSLDSTLNRRIQACQSHIQSNGWLD